MKHSLRYINFTKFYNENAHKLHMPQPINYPLNYNKARTWIDSHCDKDSRMFAEDIIVNTTYISFGYLMERLKIICKDFVDMIKKKRNVYVVLVLPHEVKKSNLWVSMLSFDFIAKVIDDVYFDVTDAYNDTHDESSPLYGKNVVCVLCDDCAYTGQQMMSTVTIDYAKLKFINVPDAPPETDVKWLEWHEKISVLSQKYLKSISPDKFSVYLIVPFMSAMSEDIVNKLPYVFASKLCLIVPLLRQNININKYHHATIREFNHTFHYHDDISAVYFDHKVADAVSTFHKVYLLAPIFGCSIKNKSMKFIDGCPNITTIQHDIDIWDTYIELEDKLDKPCPQTFYKSISYTFNNIVINNKDLVSSVLGDSVHFSRRIKR
jgi:hypothetical protein